MAYCPICERKFDTKSGLQGHFRFKHGYEVRQGKPAKETLLTRAIKQNIERGVSGVAVMKAIEEEKRDEQLDRGKSGEESEYVPKKSSGFIDKVNGIEMRRRESKFIDRSDMRTKDSKFVKKVEFE